MAFITWISALDTGIRIIDEQHHELVRLINELHDEVDAPIARVNATIEALVKYATLHFTTEETLMTDTNYHDTTSHGNEHKDFAIQLVRFTKKSFARDPALRHEVLAYLRTWLVEHIQGADMALGPHLKAHGVS